MWWRTSNCSPLLIYRPREDERLSWPGRLTYSGRLTHISGHPPATGRVQDGERTLTRDWRSTTEPRGPTLTVSNSSLFTAALLIHYSHSLVLSVACFSWLERACRYWLRLIRIPTTLCAPEWYTQHRIRSAVWYVLNQTNPPRSEYATYGFNQFIFPSCGALGISASKVDSLGACQQFLCNSGKYICEMWQTVTPQCENDACTIVIHVSVTSKKFRNVIWKGGNVLFLLQVISQ